MSNVVSMNSGKTVSVPIATSTTDAMHVGLNLLLREVVGRTRVSFDPKDFPSMSAYRPISSCIRFLVNCCARFTSSRVRAHTHTFVQNLLVDLFQDKLTVFSRSMDFE